MLIAWEYVPWIHIEGRWFDKDGENMGGIDWYGFIVAAVAVVLAPGPGSLFVARNAALSGVGAGIRAMLGIMLGDTCLIALSFFGISALFVAHPALFHVVRLLGACYLIYLGIISLIRSQGEGAERQERSSVPFRKAFTITLLNPKAVLFFTAFFPLFIENPVGGLFIKYACLALIFMVLSATYLMILTNVTVKVGVQFRRNKLMQSIARKACGCLFIAFGVKVAVTAR
jgi:leucine efflux protein